MTDDKNKDATDMTENKDEKTFSEATELEGNDLGLEDVKVDNISESQSVPELDLVDTSHVETSGVDLTKPEPEFEFDSDSLATPQPTYATQEEPAAPMNPVMAAPSQVSGNQYTTGTSQQYPTYGTPVSPHSHPGSSQQFTQTTYPSKSSSWDLNKFTYYGLISNIVGLVLTFIPGLAFFTFFAAVGGVLFSIMGLVKKEPLKPLAIIGVVAGGLGLIIGFVIMIILLFFFGAVFMNYT